MENQNFYLTETEITILKNNFISIFLSQNKKVRYILKSNSDYSEIILFIFIIEKMNRGGILSLTSEKLVTLLFPKFVIKFNFSVGPFQLKPSFLKLYAPDIDISKAFNIDNCILILDNFFIKTKHLNRYQQISLYHSGEIENNFKSTHTYCYLYTWFKNKFNFS